MNSDSLFQEILLASAKKSALARQDTQWVPVRYDILYRLRCDVFQGLDAVDIEDGSDKQGKEQRSSLSSHGIATQFLAELLIYTMRISSYDLNEFLSHASRADDTSNTTPCHYIACKTPITTIDFVKHVLDFMKQHEDQIRACRMPFAHTFVGDSQGIRQIKDETFRQMRRERNNTNFFFSQAWISIQGVEAAVTVHIFAAGELGKMAVTFWDSSVNTLQNNDTRVKKLSKHSVQASLHVALDQTFCTDCARTYLGM